MASFLKAKYLNEVIPALKKELGIANLMALPRLEKIVMNMGLGKADSATFDARLNEMAAITGQRPVVRKAKRSISNFKLRRGMRVGAQVTLRGERMYEFMHRLVSAALPRIRDFRGLSPTGFDGGGNYSMGVKDHTIFPELSSDKVTGTQGMHITFVTRNADDQKARVLLKLMGLPFAEPARPAEKKESAAG